MASSKKEPSFVPLLTLCPGDLVQTRYELLAWASENIRKGGDYSVMIDAPTIVLILSVSYVGNRVRLRVLYDDDMLWLSSHNMHVHTNFKLLNRIKA